MTDTIAASADSNWQTKVWHTAAAVTTVFAGRLVCGANFGFVIFLLVWVPILAIWIGGHSATIGRWMSGGVLLAVTASMMSGWPTEVAFHLIALLVLFAVTSSVVSTGLSRFVGNSVASAVAGICWLTWLTVPMLMAGSLAGWLSEPILIRMWAIHPLVVCNVADATAGDWTHQALAYTTLTRLGQDIPFEWPQSIWPSTVAHGLIIVFSTLIYLIVPRGTSGSK